MPKRDPRITEAAQCRIAKQHARFDVLYGKLLVRYKPTRLARLIDDEEKRLARVAI